MYLLNHMDNKGYAERTLDTLQVTTDVIKETLTEHPEHKTS